MNLFFGVSGDGSFITSPEIGTFAAKSKRIKRMKTLEKVQGDYDTQLNDWIEHEKAALDLINVVGKLWFEKSIELILFHNQLVDRSASEIGRASCRGKSVDI